MSLRVVFLVAPTRGVRVAWVRIPVQGHLPGRLGLQGYNVTQYKRTLLPPLSWKVQSSTSLNPDHLTLLRERCDTVASSAL